MHSWRDRGAFLMLVGMAALGLAALAWGVGNASPGASATPTPTPSPILGPTPVGPGTMRYCPPYYNPAFSVWDGRNDIDASEALATCGTRAVAAAFALDPETQVWSRWFAGRPDISDLRRLTNFQVVITMGRAEALVSPTPPPSPTASPTPTPTSSPTPSATPTPVPILPGCSPDVPASPLAPNAPTAMTMDYVGMLDGWWGYRVGWQDNSDDETCFGMEKRLDDGPWQWGGPVPANVTSYTFGANFRGRLCQRVYAGNEEGRSDYSDIACLDVPPPPGAVFNCPRPGKWAISVWVGPDHTDTSEVLNTCGASAVAAVFALDPGSQMWSRWVDLRPDISNLPMLNEFEGFLALGAEGVPATPLPTPTPTPAPTPMGIVTGTGVVADGHVFNFGTGDIYYSRVGDGARGYLYGSSYSLPHLYFGDVIRAPSPCASNYSGYQGVEDISGFRSAEEHTFTSMRSIMVGDKASGCYQGILLFHQGMYYGGIDILDIDNEGNLHYRFWYDPSGGTNF